MALSHDQSLIIIPYDAIFSNNWRSVTYCLVFLVFNKVKLT